MNDSFNPYVPILVMFGLSFGFVVFSLTANALAGPKRYNRAKLDAYECGVEPTPHAVGGGRFPVKYYLVAMTFIVFDIEVVFLYPVGGRLRRARPVRAGRHARLPVPHHRSRSSTSGAGVVSSGTEHDRPRTQRRSRRR